MDKDQALSYTTGHISFRELQQTTKMGLIQGNLIPTSVGA